MMESCGMNFIKYVLFVFNLVFAISGAALIVAGALVLTNVDEFGYFLEARITAPPIVLIVVGSVVFFVAFLGCCGAIKESYNLLIAFAVLLLVIFIAELAVGIAASLAKDDFSETMKSAMQKSMINYNKSQLDKEAWDNMQKKLQCCGLDNKDNWASITPPNTYPLSCCTNPSSSDRICLDNGVDGEPNVMYYEGCFEKLKMRVKDGAVVIMGVGIGIAFVELVGIVFACCLASSIKKGKEEGGEEEGGGGGGAEEE